jgi:hypothetical protein
MGVALAQDQSDTKFTRDSIVAKNTAADNPNDPVNKAFLDALNTLVAEVAEGQNHNILTSKALVDALNAFNAKIGNPNRYWAQDTGKGIVFQFLSGNVGLVGPVSMSPEWYAGHQVYRVSMLVTTHEYKYFVYTASFYDLSQEDLDRLDLHPGKQINYKIDGGEMIVYLGTNAKGKNQWAHFNIANFDVR